MIELSTIRDLVAIFGVIAGFSYYVLTVRNQAKITRIQLLSQLYSRFRSPTGSQQYFELLNAEWSDYDDFERKYGSDSNPQFAGLRYFIWSTYNDVGYLVRQGLIDIEDVYNIVGTGISWTWSKYESIIEEQRRRYNGADWHRDFEYIAKELLKMKIARDPSYKVPDNLSKYIPNQQSPRQ